MIFVLPTATNEREDIVMLFMQDTKTLCDYTLSSTLMTYLVYQVPHRGTTRGINTGWVRQVRDLWFCVVPIR